MAALAAGEDARVEQARALLALGRGREAADLLGSAGHPVLRAEALLATGAHGPAEEALQGAEGPEATSLRAWLQWRGRAEPGCPEALRLAKVAAEGAPEAVEILAEAAALAMACKDEGAARALHLQARAFERSDLVQRRAAAELRRTGGDPEGAARLLARAVALYPQEGEVRRDLGVAWLDAGQAARAVDAFQQALPLPPYQQDLQKGERVLALGSLSAEARAEKVDELWTLLGRALDAHGDPANAAAALERAILVRRTPTAADWIGLAERYSRLRMHSRAVEAGQSAARLEPMNAAAWRGLALVQLHAGRPADAVGSARRALDLEPAEPEASLLLARGALQVGDTTEARRTLESALLRLGGAAHPRRAELVALLQQAGG